MTQPIVSLAHGNGALLHRVDVLYAIEEIKLLKSRYFQAVDEKDYAAIEGLFIPDAVVDFSGEQPHHLGHHGMEVADPDPRAGLATGGEETAQVIAAAIRSYVTVHHGHDPQITITDINTARGRWTLYDRIEYPAETMEGYGYYLESYRRGPDGWQIASLTLKRYQVVWKATV